MFTTFFTWPMFLKFNWSLIHADDLPHFRPSFRQTVDCDGRFRSGKRSSNNRITSFIISVLK